MAKKFKHYADGKSREKSRIEKIKDIERIYGISRVSPFGTGNEEVFEEAIADLDLKELARFAEKVGVRTSANKQEAKAALRKAFTDWQRRNGDQAAESIDKPQAIVNNEPSEQALRVLEALAPKTLLQKEFPDAETEEQFEKVLSKMRLSELRNLAARLGHNPSFDQQRLIVLLSNAFKEDAKSRIKV